MLRAMILAAGRGERLRPLTDSCPKPLVPVGGKPLIFWHLEKLKALGVTEVVVNSAYLSEKIVEALGDGSQFGLHITHSVEGPGGLETAGGIIQALPHLSEEFLVLNGDTLMDGDYAQFLKPIPRGCEALLFLTANPAHNLKGDFTLEADGSVKLGPGLTFSGAARYKKSAFSEVPQGRLPLRPLFEKWSAAGCLAGVRLEGRWFDVGTLERLAEVNDYLTAKA